jgi:hypothetical protein
MLRDRLTDALRATFPDRPFRYPAVGPIATLPAPCPAVGELAVEVDGDEAVVGLTGITHGHFAEYADLPGDGRARSVCEAVTGFVAALLADRVLLYRSPDGRVGGWVRLDLLHDPHPRRPGYEYYLWSGPAPG